MWRLATLLGLAAAADFNLKCHDDRSVTIDIPYQKYGIKVMNLTYGSCDQFASDVDITYLGSVANSNFTVHIAMDMAACNMLDIDEQDALILLGIPEDNLYISKHNVNSSCYYDSEFTVEFDYKVGEQKYTFTNGTDVNCTFEFTPYDSTFTNVIAESPDRAGAMIHLAITESCAINHCTKFFVPKSCKVVDDTGLEYQMYDYDGKCTNDFVNFDIEYNRTTHMWQVQHRLFLLNNTRESMFSLICTIVLCDASVADSSCVRVMDSCFGGIAGLEDETCDETPTLGCYEQCIQDTPAKYNNGAEVCNVDDCNEVFDDGCAATCNITSGASKVFTTCDDLYTTAICVDPEPTTAPEPVTKCPESGEPYKVKHDVIVLVDGSTSITSPNFVKSIQFVRDLKDRVEIGPNATRFGMVQFASWPQTEFKFLDSSQAIDDALDGVDQIRWFTKTGKAITHVENDILPGMRGSTETADNILIVLTDGEPQDDVLAPSIAIKAAGMKVYGVGIGVDFSVENSNGVVKLRQIASDPDVQFMWREANHDALVSIAQDMSKEMCEDSGVATTLAPLPCSSSPCLNDGACTNSDAIIFSCTCGLNWTGDYCQTPDPCGNSPCAGGERCTPKNIVTFAGDHDCTVDSG